MSKYNKRFDDLLAILPYCNEVHFFDNRNCFIEAAEYRNGNLIIKNGVPPDWIKGLKQRISQ